MMDDLKPMGDTLSFGVIIAWLWGVIPQATIALSFVWIIMRIYDTYLDIQQKRKGPNS